MTRTFTALEICQIAFMATEIMESDYNNHKSYFDIRNKCQLITKGVEKDTIFTKHDLVKIALACNLYENADHIRAVCKYRIDKKNNKK